MPKNLNEVLKGAIDVSDIKGTWDVTPIVSSELTVLDSVNMSWDPATKTGTTTFMGAATVNQGVAGAIIFDNNYDDLAVDEVRQFAMKAGADFDAHTGTLALLSTVVVPDGYTAAELAALFVSYLQGGTVYTTPLIQNWFIKYHNTRMSVEATSRLTKADGTVSTSISTLDHAATPIDSTSLGALYLTRKQPGGAGTATEVKTVSAVFNATNELISIGNIGTVTGDPQIPAGNKLGLVILYFPNTTVYENLSASVSLDTAPASIVVPVDFGTPATPAGATYHGLTQADFDLALSAPAGGLISLSYPSFPVGAAVNDKWRISNLTPLYQSKPYNVPVLDEDIILVDNVSPGSESFRVDPSTARLNEVQAEAQLGITKADAAAVGGSRVVFFVRSHDAAVADPLPPGTPHVYDTHLQAYLAATALPKHIRKVIVFDNRSTAAGTAKSVEPWIPSAGVYNTFYYAANNIALSTMTHWMRNSGDHTDALTQIVGSVQWHRQIVKIKASCDALHFEGGNFAVFYSGNPAIGETLCVNLTPDATVSTPTGIKRALEMGDGTQLYLSPLSFDLNNWGAGGTSAAMPTLTVGNKCSLTILPDFSHDEPSLSYFNDRVRLVDIINSTPGQLKYLPGGYTNDFAGVKIKLGEDSSFIIEGGYAEFGGGVIDSPGFVVEVPERYGVVDFGFTDGTLAPYPIHNSIRGPGILSAAISAAITQSNDAGFISNKQEFLAACSSITTDVNGNVTYAFSGNKTYILATTINLGATGHLLPQGNGLKFIGIGPSSGFHSSNPNGWLRLSDTSSYDIVMENLTVGGGISAKPTIFYQNTLAQYSDAIFRRCYFEVDAGVNVHLIPLGSGGTILYEDCVVNQLGGYTLVPDTVEHNVTFDRMQFNDRTSNAYYSTIPFFDFSNKTINGSIKFRKCHVSGSNYPAGQKKRTLLAARTVSGTVDVVITNPGGLTVEHCTKGWSDATFNGNNIILGSFRSVPNLVFVDTTIPEVKIRGKRVVDVYTAADWPQPIGTNTWINLPANTIFRIHGTVEVPATRCYLAIGTEIVGTGKTILDSQLHFGAAGHQPTGNDSYLIACGDDFVIQNLLIMNGSAGASKAGLIIQPDTANAGIGAPAEWHTGKAIVIDDVIFPVNDPFNQGDRAPIRVMPAVSVGYTPSIELGNVFCDDQPTYTIDISSAAGVYMVDNLTIRDVKGALPDAAYKRPQVVFGDKYWSGAVTVRDNDLSQSPITISATGVAALTGTNRVTAFNNRGITAAGVYNNALSTYVDGILMSDATLMLAQGNILGAPNSP